MPKVSVIIPVYNVADKIIRCIDSLLAQTLEDVEFILVDDHGQDNSIDMAKQHIANHKQVNQFVFTETPVNSGPGIARNVGMELAKGDYVAFCDADDWVEPTMYAILYENAIKYKAELSCVAAVLAYSNGKSHRMNNPQVGSGALSIQKRKYILTHFVSNFTTFIFERGWLMQNHIFFPSERSGEDSCFMGCCYLCAARIAQTNQPMYHYVIDNNSISHRKGVFRGKEKCKVFALLFRFAKEHDLMKTYRWQLYFVYFKKAIVTSIIDYFKSL